MPPLEFWLTFAIGLALGLTFLWDFERAVDEAAALADEADRDVPAVADD